MAQQSDSTNSTAIGFAGQFVAMAITVLTVYEVTDAGILTRSFNPAWWVYLALPIAVIISIWSAGKIWN